MSIWQTQQRLLQYAKQFKLGHWCFCGRGQEKCGIIRTILERFQLCIYAAVCVLFDQHYRNQEVIVKARNFPQKTSRT